MLEAQLQLEQGLESRIVGAISNISDFYINYYTKIPCQGI